MKKSFFTSLAYNDWANEKIIEKLSSSEKYPDRCLDLVCHIISLQDYWYDRLVNKSIYLIDLWETYSLAECLPLSKASTETWKEYIGKTKEKEFKNLCGYYGKDGTPLDISVGDIINHVLNHSAYHRGQINLLLKNSGQEPADIDFSSYASF